MKTVRFTQLVKASGKPVVHLVFVAPAKDRELQRAVKGDRVLTVLQPSVGTASDRGEVGFEEGSGRQYLIFPKSLKRFAGAKVVGIKYDLLETPAVSKEDAARLVTQRKREARKRAKKAAEKRASAGKRARAAEKASASASASAGRRGRKEESRREAEPEPEPESVKERQAEVEVEPKPESSAKRKAASPESKFKKEIARAIALLEQGKQVAALRVLERVRDG